MVDITFYEKPGCISNSKQKKLLSQSGISYQAVNLLDYPWTAEELMAFFQGEAVANWINSNAPQVKSGELDAAQLTQQEALDIMVANPILIRRPLIACTAGKWAGFDLPRIASVLGLKGQFTQDAAMESCSHPAEGDCSK